MFHAESFKFDVYFALSGHLRLAEEKQETNHIQNNVAIVTMIMKKQNNKTEICRELLEGLL